MMPLSPPHILTSPSGSSRYSDGLPFPRAQSMSDFEVEHSLGKMPGTPSQARRRTSSSNYDSEAAYAASISTLIAAKARPFAVSGRIPVDPVDLTLFFRSKSGITHSLDFPIDMELDVPPALDVLIAACRPHLSSGLDEYPENESVFYPAGLPLTTTLEIANHPILDAVRNTLFPSLPSGHYLTAVRDTLEIWLKGNRPMVQPRANDTRVATIVVTLPVRFRGGALVVRNMDGAEERFFGRGGKPGDMEWTAFMGDCDFEIETVQKGARITLSYAVQLRTFGPAGIQPDPLIAPSDQFLDTLSPILNMSRGRRIAFYLTGEYGVNPAEVLAESLVPELKGGDSILYHALKLYKLSPELRWTAGGYIWSVDQTVDLIDGDGTNDPPPPRAPFGVPRQGVPPIRGTFSTHGDYDDEETEDIRAKVERSGAVPIADADVTVLNDPLYPGPISKERMPFVGAEGEMEKLVVNVLMVVYVP